MLGSFKITKEHGQLCESTQFGVKVFPLYHPAYVKAYAYGKMKEFKTDIKSLREILKELR